MGWYLTLSGPSLLDPDHSDLILLLKNLHTMHSYLT